MDNRDKIDSLGVVNVFVFPAVVFGAAGKFIAAIFLFFGNAQRSIDPCGQQPLHQPGRKETKTRQQRATRFKLFFFQRSQAQTYLAVGQQQRYHFGVGAPPILLYFSADWDDHGYDLAFDPWPFGLSQVFGRMHMLRLP